MARVLVLEDEPIISMMVKDWLTELDCETVGPVSTVAGALDIVRSQDVDAAILDLAVGKENSSAVADALSARHVPFAFATGYNAGSLPEGHKGAVVLSKPFKFGDFKKTVELLLPSL